MEYSVKKMTNLLEENEFSIKKSFGQNFIIDENTINNIVLKAEIDSETLVIEIGVGMGSLTYKLCEVAKNVLCYEIDTKLKSIIDYNLKDCTNVEVIYKDFLKCDLKEDLKKYDYKKIYVVANLPYYITTPIIMKLIEFDIDKIVVMVQKEVGNRFNAQIGTKDYNSLSVYLNYYFDIKKVMNVSKNVFLPKPKVDSVVISLEKKKQQYVKSSEYLFKLIRDSFKQKRKTIRNNLRDYDLEKIEEVLKKHSLDLNSRAEKVSLEVFIDIVNHIL